MIDEQRGRCEQEIGAEHAQLAVRHVHHPAHPIDEDIAAGEQRIDRRKHDDVDEKLHLSGGRLGRVLTRPNIQGKALGLAKALDPTYASYFTSYSTQSFACTMADLASSQR